MAALSLLSVIRAVTKCRHLATSIAVVNVRNIAPKIQAPACTRLLSTSQQDTTQTNSSPEQSDYPSGFEVSYKEFQFVEDILPQATVPAIPHHESYPTPSGWYPPNDALRSQHKFLVLRTKHHSLPVYLSSRSSWMGLSHTVTIKKVEGDIWALESELSDYLKAKTGVKEIKTQVHEVARLIRVRGLHMPLVVEFLLAKGM